MTQVWPANDESHTEEVFILELWSPAQGRFVTSVSSRDAIEPARLRHNARETRVAHWRRDALSPVIQPAPAMTCRDWRLNERFVL